MIMSEIESCCIIQNLMSAPCTGLSTTSSIIYYLVSATIFMPTGNLQSCLDKLNNPGIGNYEPAFEAQRKYFLKKI